MTPIAEGDPTIHAWGTAVQVGGGGAALSAEPRDRKAAEPRPGVAWGP